jgi:uncharacterized protein
VKINIESITSGKIGEKFQQNFSYDVNSDNNPVVQGQIFVMKTNYGVGVHADCSTILRRSCGRCLDDIKLPLKFSFNERFLKEKTESPENELSNMADAFTIEADGTIDVSQALEQYLVLETPLKSLCGDNCKGLCQQCGSNLNQGTCSCVPRLSHPAWENLRDLWENKKESV